jgi:hypothetical protein
MALRKVDSSMVYALDYDPKAKTLEVVFRKGGIFLYHDVPPAEYRRMMKSGSIGSYMRGCIIGTYEEDRL